MRALLPTAAVAILAGLLVGVPSAAPAEATVASPVDDLVEGLLADPVVVDPDTTVRLSTAQLDQLHDDTGAAPDPLYVAVLGSLPRGTASTKQLAAELYDALHDATGETPWVVVYADDTLPAFGGAEPDDEHLDRFVASIAAVGTDQGTPTERLLTLTGRLAGRLHVEQPFADDGLGPDADDTDGAAPGHVTVGRVVLVVAAVLVLLALLAAALRFLARSGASRWRSHRFGRAVDEGTEADRSIRARREVVALGSLLDSTSLDPDDDPDGWQRALDAYDTASRLLDRATTTEELEEVLRRCAAGTAALHAAQRKASRRGR